MSRRSRRSRGKTEEFLGWSSIVATIATVILALTALVTVYITVSAWGDKRDSDRPYFTLKDSPKVVQTPELNFEFKFFNVGIHPAVNLRSRTLVFNQNLSMPPIHKDEFALVNEIPKDTSSSLVISIAKSEIDPNRKNIDPNFIVIDLSYVDPILKKPFAQSIFLKWNGVINGQIQPLVHLRLEEKDKIMDYLKKQGFELQNPQPGY